MSEEVDVTALQDQLTTLQESNQALTDQFDAIKSKNDELLTETKTAKEAKRKAEADAITEKDRMAKESGDFESLYKSSSEKLQMTESTLSQLQGRIEKEQKGNAAMKIAADLAEGSNIDLLSTFINTRLSFQEGNLKVTDGSGNLTISSLDDLKAEFKNDPKFASLLKGNQSSGGGATGGDNTSGGAAKTKSRAEFMALNPTDRMKFTKTGGTVY
jgi:chromosome segregation ATPase